jgi:hypothetical protein
MVLRLRLHTFTPHALSVNPDVALPLEGSVRRRQWFSEDLDVLGI